MRHRSIITLVPAALLAAAAGLHAQETTGTSQPELSTTRGWEVGVRLSGTAIYPNDGSAESGFGGGLRFGYGVSYQYMVFADADGASMQYRDGPGSYALVHVGLGVRRTFGTLSDRTRPYGELALTGVGVADDVEGHSVTITGGSFQVGVGFERFLSRRSALDLGLEMGPGRLTNVTVDGDTSPIEAIAFTTIRVRAGFTFHP